MKNQNLTALEDCLPGDFYKLNDNVVKEYKSLCGIPVEKLRKVLVIDTFNHDVDGEVEMYYRCSYPEQIDIPQSLFEKLFTRQ